MGRIENIRDYLFLSDQICTAGQPSRDQFKFIKGNGYETVINLALSTSNGALPEEKEIVENSGMKYFHIPVQWEAPSNDLLLEFFNLMDSLQDNKKFVHCIANKRVSVFLYLYRIWKNLTDNKTALNDLNKIWIPNDIWQNFIESAIRVFSD